MTVISFARRLPTAASPVPPTPGTIPTAHLALAWVLHNAPSGSDEAEEAAQALLSLAGLNGAHDALRAVRGAA